MVSDNPTNLPTNHQPSTPAGVAGARAQARVPVERSVKTVFRFSTKVWRHTRRHRVDAPFPAHSGARLQYTYTDPEGRSRGQSASEGAGRAKRQDAYSIFDKGLAAYPTPSRRRSGTGPFDRQPHGNPKRRQFSIKTATTLQPERDTKRPKQRLWHFLITCSADPLRLAKKATSGLDLLRGFRCSASTASPPPPTDPKPPSPS